MTTLVMLNEVKHPDWIYLTLSAGADVPLLLHGAGHEGEVCHPRFVMLNEASVFPFCHAERSEASILWIPRWRSE